MCDRNDQPVAGAVVRFAISNGRASFSGARTLTVTTNAAGRAAATGLTPTGGGAVQIGASAAFQGQTAAVTIAQTNVMTAAQAAAATSGSSGATGGGGAGAAGGSGGGAAGGSGGGASAGSGAAAGGGLSATTLGIVGGAIAGGAIATKKVLGGGGGTVYSGSFSGQQTFPLVNGPSCLITRAHQGTVRIENFQAAGDGTVTGIDHLEHGESSHLVGRSRDEDEREQRRPQSGDHRDRH